MSDEILISKVELDNLNERVKKLAVEKSYLQVFIHLMNEMSTVSGLENTIQKLLQIILGNIGGSNLIIYYLIDEEIFYADVLGEKKKIEQIEQIEDDIVKKVFETKELIEIQSDFSDTKLLGVEFTKASTWAFPLLVGNDLIGVLKIEDLYTGTTDLHFHLPTFFSYAAHILKNEILGHTKLKRAFDLLTDENNLRKQAEEKLKTINEELENRVEERTLELHHLNLQLEEELAVRQSAEAQILKLNRIYSVLSNINQAIVRIHDAGKILNEACRIAIEDGKFQMAWIGMVNFQTNKVEVAASYGISRDYLESIDIDLTDELRSNGPTGTTIKTGEHKISNNINNDESMLPWREKAIKYGYKSSASFPLSVFDKVIGAFNIYSDENDFFQEDDITLLDEMVKDISFALEYIQSENDRKQTELQLIKSEREYRSLAENLPDNIIRYDRQCRAIYGNTKMTQTLTVGPELMLGKTPLEFGAGGPEVDAEYENHIRRVLDTGESSDLEIVMPYHGGGFHSHLIRFVAERDTEGSIVGVLAIGQDINDRKRAEDALRESETKLRVMFENSRDAIGVSKKGVHVFANPAYLKLFGYEKLEDIIGTLILDCIAPSHHQQIIQNVQRRASGEDVLSFYETRGRKRDGSEFDFEINVSIYELNGEDFTLANIRDITDRKQSEIQLRNSEREYRTLAENIPDHIMRYDLNSRAVYINHKMESTKFTKSTLIGKLPTENKFVRGDGVEIYNEKLNSVIKTGKEEEMEFILPDLEGNIHIHEVHFLAERNIDGEIIGAITIAHNITELKMAEDTLRQAADEILDLYNHAPCGYHSLDKDGLFVRINETELEWLGFERDEVLGKMKFTDLLTATSLKTFVKNFPNFKKSGIIQDLEFEMKCKNGFILTALVSATAITDKNGNYLMSRSTVYDITGRKQIEEALRESEERYRLIAENTADTIAVFDMNMNYTYVSPSVIKLLGYTPDELMGLGLEKIVSPNSWQMIQQIFIEEMEYEKSGKADPNRSRIFITEQYCKDNTKIWVEGTTSFIRDKIGKPINILAISRDITDRKLAEEEILKLNTELEKRVRDRTASLEAANKELEAFSYSVSHDLRAPLRHIDGFLTLLQEKMETNFDEESTHYMAIILRAAKRMDVLIEDLLSFSRMGRYELSKMKVNLNLLVRDVIQEIEPDLLNRKINWQIAELPVVSGDSSMLRIVLVNLISNALKFTRFRLQTEIEIGCLTNQQGEIIIFVRDNGVGFDMNYSDRLFGVFQRLHSNEEFEGTGIGLANVHRIISRHGGKTWGVGEINKGATFYFTIPEGIQNEK